MKQFAEDDIEEKTQTASLRLPDNGSLDTPPIAVDKNGVSQVVGVLNRRTENWWLLAAFWAMFLCGWNDASIGPLLLRIQSYYEVSYTVVSLLFITAFCGFFTAAVINVPVVDRFGIGWAFAIGSTSPIIAYIIQSTAPPFPLFLISYVFSGIGVGLLDAVSNTLIARLPDAEKQMSLLHAAYGAGALVAPLVATQFSEMKRWNFHYLTSLGMAAICLFLVTVTFRFKTIEKLFSDAGYIEVVLDEKAASVTSTTEPILVDEDHHDRRHIQPNEEGIVAVVNEGSKPAGSVKKMGKIIRDPVVLLTAAFAFLYVGTEITIGGWIVTFLRTVRGAGPSAGYVSTGFFAGLTLGRVVHVWIARLAPERYLLFGYGVMAIALQIVVWTVKHVVGDAIAISFVGFVLGPFYPIIMNVLVAILPVEITGGAIGFVAAVGQIGSALFPYAVGPLSEHYGVWSLQPLLVAMMGSLLLFWVIVLWVCRNRWKVKP
ncbi:hypothetical protein NliqN6_6036 [Naganishia liquefaciens]|uniref:Major facilitator superfamily (MFS) profile domain-containing protein n=1 Tax=Naganishia liquefaciens TaxID=104408 RepID=A0A8H3YHA4_9TREE|nr:hypothetical protein NliqN6_6036 [Naganishia liquefaciens]